MSQYITHPLALGPLRTQPSLNIEDFPNRYLAYREALSNYFLPWHLQLPSSSASKPNYPYHHTNLDIIIPNTQAPY